MNYIDNRRWLGQHFREVAELVREWDDKEPTGDVIVEPSRKGELTMQLNVNGTMKYVHSKYDPKREVDRLLKSFDETLSAPALFFGVGLGYHIEAFIQRYPYRKFIIFEPNLEVFVSFLKRVNLTKWKKQNIIGIYVGENAIIQQWSDWVNVTKGQVQFIYLPHYEQKYRTSIQFIQNDLKTYLSDYKSSISADLSLQRSWTLNAVKNFPYLLSTKPFLMHEENSNLTDDDVAYLVAAGPSLSLEKEKLKYIRENYLGHIFSVGSAINALISYGIEPHATFAYDPSPQQYLVTKRLKELSETNTKFIFGSTVGHQSLEEYPHELRHIIMSQDYLSPHLLKRESSIDIPVIWDAPSIAVVALQTLIRLGYKKIVFVGQNLGYSGEYRYAEGIDYDFSPSLITEEQKEQAIYTTDTEGREILTNESFESMKQQLELHISYYPKVQFINTTRGGAHIKGTKYQTLEEVIEQIPAKSKLPEIFDTDLDYDYSYAKKQLIHFEKFAKELEQDVRLAMDSLIMIARQMDKASDVELEKLFGVFDKSYAKIERNYFYQFVVKSMLRVQFEQLETYVAEVKNELNYKRKSVVIVDAFNTYLNVIYQHYLYIYPHFEQMKEESLEIIKQKLGE